MLINNEPVKTKGCFAYDGCHKIYIIEDNQDHIEALESDYKIHNIDDLEDIYLTSCPLKFISNWKLTITYAEQSEDAIFGE